MASSRCRSQGRRGLGAGLEGHARSLAPRNQRASKLEPADSSGPMIWMGAWRDSGAKSVCAAMRSSAARAAEKRTRVPSERRVEVQGRQLVERALPLAPGLELGAAVAAASGPACGFEQLVEGCGPFGVGLYCAVDAQEDRSQCAQML